MKPFNPEEIKTFKTPKYGGITLSLLSMFVLASMIVVWNKIGEQEQEQFKKSISIHCDESFAIPVKQCAEQFEREMKIKVSIHSTSGLDQNGSKAKESVNGDAYDLDLSAGKPTLEGLSLNQVPCAFRSIVFATRKDFEPNLTKLDQVFQNNLIYSTSPDSARDGRLLEYFLGKTVRWQEVLSQREKVYPSSSAAGLELASGNDLDGAFMWDFSARKFDLKIHRIKELELVSETLWARTFDSAQNRLPAVQFARFLAAPTKGQFYFAESGFVGINGDAWTDKPFLYVYCATLVEDFIRDKFDRFERDALVSIEPHFLDREKIALSLSLIAQSKAKKALPDLVLGLPEGHNAQMPDQYQSSAGTFVINNTRISVSILKSTRFPLSSRNLRDFLLAKEKNKP